MVRSTLFLKTALVLFALVLVRSLLANSAKDWDYQYGIASPGRKNETVYGNLLYDGHELPKSYQQVVTPIGEFVYVDAQAPVLNKKIGWVPYGTLPGDLKGTQAFAHTRRDVKWLMDPSIANSRRTPSQGDSEQKYDRDYTPGTLEKRPDVARSNWFFAVALKLWVNPHYGTNPDDAWRFCGSYLVTSHAAFSQPSTPNPDWLGGRDYLLVTADVAKANSGSWLVIIPFTIKNVSDGLLAVYLFPDGEIAGLAVVNENGQPSPIYDESTVTMVNDEPTVTASRTSAGIVILKPGETRTIRHIGMIDTLKVVAGRKLVGAVMGFVGDPPKAFVSYSAPFVLSPAVLTIPKQ